LWKAQRPFIAYTGMSRLGFFHTYLVVEPLLGNEFDCDLLILAILEQLSKQQQRPRLSRAQDESIAAMHQPPNLEFILKHFLAESGLYILGAGVSAGSAPLGVAFWRAAALDYLRNVGSFPADITTQAELTTRIIDKASTLTVDDIWPGRDIRPGTESPPYAEILRRLPGLFVRFHLRYVLSSARYRAAQNAGTLNHSYGVFQHFHPSMIANYNHDGLAKHFCGNFHAVLDMHGSVEPGYGAPSIAEFVGRLRKVDLPEPPDDILMGVSESYFSSHPAQRRFRRQLARVAAFAPDFVAIIGYSFAQDGTPYDDSVSLNSFLETRRDFPGRIYIIQPAPDAMCAIIADTLRSRNVFPIRGYWNVLAHAFIRKLSGRDCRRSLNYVCEQTLDRYGHDLAFPLNRKE
jgi:hypothetical protein